jgi:hypothetical protein
LDFGWKKDDMTERWRGVHGEEFHSSYSSASIIKMIESRRMRCAGYVAQMREKSNTYRLFAGKPEGKRPLGRPSCRWVDGSWIERGWDGADLTGLA